MALGTTAIQNARDSLNVIKKNLDAASTSNREFINLFNDANFQKFVKETNKGKTLNDQLKALSDWLTSLESVVQSLDDKTSKYLSTQDSLNG
jgi:hypothetical protein